MIALHLYWKHNGTDVDLGTGFLQHVPQTGTLLRHVADQGVMWCIVQVVQDVVAAGSMTHQAWVDGRRREAERIDVFVEPDEGPFEP